MIIYLTILKPCLAKFLKCLVTITSDKNYNLFSISTEGPRKFIVLKLKNTPTYKIFRILKTECKYMKTV